MLLLISVFLSLRVEFFLASLCDSFNDVIIILRLLDGIDPGAGLCLVFGAELDGGQYHPRFQIQCVHWLEVDDPSKIW